MPFYLQLLHLVRHVVLQEDHRHQVELVEVGFVVVVELKSEKNASFLYLSRHTIISVFTI